jgi:hypothetical protein
LQADLTAKMGANSAGKNKYLNFPVMCTTLNAGKNLIPKFLATAMINSAGKTSCRLCHVL